MNSTSLYTVAPTPTPSPLLTAYGEWIQVQWNVANVLGSYQLLPRYGVTTSVFQAFTLLGSNDGTTWYFIHASTSPLLWSFNAPNTFYVTPMQAYQYYRLVVTRAFSPAEIGGWYLFDVSGNPFISWGTLVGTTQLQQLGITVATLSWSWSNAVQSSTTQPFAYILTTSNYASTYLGFLQPTEYPSANNYLVTTSAPTTSYSFLTSTSNTESIYGEWVQVQFASPIVATSLSLYPKSGSMNIPQAFTLVGYNGTWTYLMAASNLIWSVNKPLTFSIPNTTSYTTYRIIVTQAPMFTWDLGGIQFYTASGLALSGSYTYEGSAVSLGTATQTTYAYTCTPTGGTGSYTYTWTVSGGNVYSVVANTPTSASTTFTAVLKLGAATTSTASCLINDTIDGDQFTVTSSIVWQPYYLPLVLTMAPVPTPTPTALGTATQTTANYTCSVSGGSGSYSFAWKSTGGNVSSVVANTPTTTSTSSTSNFTATMLPGPSSYSTIVCTVTDTVSGATNLITGTAVWQPYYPPLTASITPVPTPTPTLLGGATQTSGTYTCVPLYGSGIYTYAWSASTTGGNVTSVVVNSLTTASTTFTATMKPGVASNTTVTCVVTDTVSGGTYTVTAKVYWQPYYTPLVVSIAPVPTPTPTLLSTASQTTSNYTCTVSGGSGSYSFVWTTSGGNVNVVNVNTVATTNASTSVANFTASMLTGPLSSSVVKCTVTDTIDGASTYATSTAIWEPYYLALIATITPVPTPTPTLISGTATQTSATYTCVPTGGSGSYSYAWTTSIVGGNVNSVVANAPTMASTTFTASMKTGPASTTNVTCLVTDTIDGATYSITSTVYWQSYYVLVSTILPLATPIPTAYLSMAGANQTSGTYTCNVSGGSGQYSFVWSISGDNLASSSISQINATSGVSSSAVVTATVNMGPAATSTLTCTITDTSYSITGVATDTILWQTYQTPATYGEWIQVQWTSAKTLGSYQLLPRYGVTTSVFRSFVILGSNDGSTWYFIHSSTVPLVWTINAPNTFYVTPYQAYTYYRLVVTQANSPAEIGGWYLYDVSGNAFALSTNTVSGANNQYLQQSGTTVATLSWSWSNAVQSSTTQPFAYILTPTNYATTYLGFLQPTEYPASNSGVATNSAPSTSYSLVTSSTATEKVYGEWVQVQFASGVTATSVSLYPKSGSMNVPNAFFILGSNNGTTWTYLMYTANLQWYVNTPFLFTIPNVTSYTYYRIVVVQAITSTWDIGGMIFSTASGLALSGTYTYTSSLVKSGASTVATLSWSWVTMDGSPTNMATLLTTPLTTWVGMSSATEYVIANDGWASTLAPSMTYTNAPLPSISQTVYGEWIQIQLTNPIVLVSVALVPYNLSKMFQSFFVLGSNDGTTWTYLTSNTNQVAWTNGPSLFTATTMHPYTYYRLVVTQAPSAFDLSGFILYSVNGPVFPAGLYYTISNNLLKFNGVTLATVSWSWTNTYTESTTQTVANILTNDGYILRPAFLGCTNASEYPASNNGYVTTAAPSTVYNYIVPDV